ncbi:MAG: rod-binding protein [Desulfobulbus sp.]|jgi:flagellar protein FlgJ
MSLPIDSTLPIAPAPSPQEQRAIRDRAVLKKSCQEFEALLTHSMFKAMRKTVPEGGLFDKDNAIRIYEDLLDQEMSSAMARNQGMGLAEQLYNQLAPHLPAEE